MDRPSESLLRWMRHQIDARGHNTATLADKLGRPRAEIRKILTGSQPMTVDDLLALTAALELSPEDVGVLGAVDAEPLPAVPEPVQFRNQPEALFRLGFDLGIDLLFQVDPAQLADWGGPAAVLDQYRERDREIPIQLDAAYHRYMDPVFDDQGVSLTLSFDKLYRCTFPW